MTETITQNDIQDARNLGHNLKNAGLTTSQLRKFLSSVNRLRQLAKGHDDAYFTITLSPQILMLQPRFVYQLAKEKSFYERGPENRLRPEYEIFKNQIIQRLNAAENNRNAFLKFCDFIEAVVAYHKEAGGE